MLPAYEWEGMKKLIILVIFILFSSSLVLGKKTKTISPESGGSSPNYIMNFTLGFGEGSGNSGNYILNYTMERQPVGRYQSLNYKLFLGPQYFRRDPEKPNIIIISPEDKTYKTSVINIKFLIDKPTSWIGFSLDGNNNVTITGDKRIYAGNGDHNIIIYANNTFGNMNASETRYFSVRVSGGGCPTLFVYDGRGYMKERKSRIHSQEGIDTIDEIVLKTKPVGDNGVYSLSLKETTLPEHSHIDSVKLFVDNEEVELISAWHSRYGDVTKALAKSDDLRTDTKVFDSINLNFLAPKLNEPESFLFRIEGYNPLSEGSPLEVVLMFFPGRPPVMVKVDILNALKSAMAIAVGLLIILVMIAVLKFKKAVKSRKWR